jgi:hypothetical protein
MGGGGRRPGDCFARIAVQSTTARCVMFATVDAVSMALVVCPLGKPSVFFGEVFHGICSSGTPR